LSREEIRSVDIRFDKGSWICHPCRENDHSDDCTTRTSGLVATSTWVGMTFEVRCHELVFLN
jgi:hypothetical protein